MSFLWFANFQQLPMLNIAGDTVCIISKEFNYYLINRYYYYYLVIIFYSLFYYFILFYFVLLHVLHT